MEENRKTGVQRYRRYYQVLEPMLARPKTRAYTMAIFSFLAVSLFGWYAIRPTIQTILFLRREIQDKARINQQMEEKITALIEAEAAYQASQPQLPLVEQAITSTPEVLELVAQLRNISGVSGSSLSAVQVPTVPLLGQDATPGAKLAQKQSDFSLTTVVDAPFPVVKSFLDAVLNTRRIVSIDAMNLRPSKEGGMTPGPGGGTFLQLVLKLKAYYQK